MAAKSRGIDISILGDKELAAKLNALPLAVQRKIVRKAMRPAAKPVLASVKAATPVDRGVLRRKLKLRALRRSRRVQGLMIPLPTRDELGITDGARGYYPTALEYGWRDRGGSHHPPISYIRKPVNRRTKLYLRQVGIGISALIDTEMR